ncbi:hypothetical protein CBR_g3772 [Chara braunii]|uniref:Uncharacterized protein n=1 Tax=Chara braunii TaxID=69332 RepID=A0A388KGG4_CHABU|nr:hypothetical protein CBR_g3772 [Chara braunii]|eukprot:GBG69073.1 hypothetical protein CBR_g3772 [Chara braunii]
MVAMEEGTDGTRAGAAEVVAIEATVNVEAGWNGGNGNGGNWGNGNDGNNGRNWNGGNGGVTGMEVGGTVMEETGTTTEAGTMGMEAMGATGEDQQNVIIAINSAISPRSATHLGNMVGGGEQWE